MEKKKNETGFSYFYKRSRNKITGFRFVTWFNFTTIHS